MIAEVAGKIISKFIEKQWPNDKTSVYEILKLACNSAWREGKFLGMTGEFFCEVLKTKCGQSYIIAPNNYPVLLAINSIVELGIQIRNPYFMFHRNGYGDVRNRSGCKWNTDVYDLGSSPVLDKNNIICRGVRIGVRPLGSPGKDEKIVIDGTYSDGSRVITYKSANQDEVCTPIPPIKTISGIEIEIKNGFTYVNNVCFTNISSISKTVTKTPVEVLAIDEFGNAEQIAVLYPGQKFSSYRKYLVPDFLCGQKCLHCLFKIGQQDDIASDTDNIIIKNEEALISLAIGVYNIYYKEQVEKGATYILQGITILGKEKREEESPGDYPIQVEGIYTGDLFGAIGRYS